MLGSCRVTASVDALVPASTLAGRQAEAPTPARRCPTAQKSTSSTSLHLIRQVKDHDASCDRRSVTENRDAIEAPSTEEWPS